MQRSRITLLTVVVTAMLIPACASDETPDDEPTPSDVDVPFDPEVDEGIDTEVEQSGNLEFDEPDEG